MDHGFYFEKTEGLFCKSASQNGIDRSWPLDRTWTIQIRKEGEKVADGELDGGAMAGKAWDLAGVRRYDGTGHH